MSRNKSLGDFDVITGPPAPPASLQKPADPEPADTAPRRQPAPARREPEDGDRH